MTDCEASTRRASRSTRFITRISRCCRDSSAPPTSTGSTPPPTRVLASEKLTTWRLDALKYYYIPSPPDGLAGITIKPTDSLLGLQQRLIDAVAPYTEKAGTATAFASAEDGRDIQGSLIDYVAAFVPDSTGAKFNPHVTIGVATQVYLDAMLSEPFAEFSFAPAGASVYQLGSYGTAQKKLHAVNLTG